VTDWTKTDITTAILDLHYFYDYIGTIKDSVETKCDVDGVLTREEYTIRNSLVFVVLFNKHTGQIKRVFMQVSLHKYFSDGYNYSDFHFKDVCSTIQSLCIEYGMNPFKARLLNIEAGFNIVPFISTDSILNCLYFFGTRPFTQMNNSYGSSVGVIAELTKESCKCYNKRSQLLSKFDIGHELLRYERKFKAMKKVNECGIYYLSDLLDHTKIYKLEKLVHLSLDELIFYEPIVLSEPLSKIDKSLLMFWSNPKAIDSLRKQNPQKYRRQKRRFKELTEANEVSILKDLKQALRTKGKDTLMVDRVTIKRNDFFLSQFRKVNVISHSSIV
jgi:hypothetical protein